MRNKIKVEDPYFEMIRMRSIQGFYAHYDIRLNPSRNKTYTLKVEDDNLKNYLASLDKGIQTVYNSYIKYDVEVEALDILILNNTIHAVDSKPICFEVSIKSALQDFFNKPNHRRTVSIGELNTHNYEFSISAESVQENMTIYQVYSLGVNRIIYPRTLTVSNEYDLLLKDQNLEIKIKPKSNVIGVENRNIQLWFDKNQFRTIEIMNLYRVLDQIKIDVNSNRNNLCGFNLFFKKQAADQEYDLETTINFEWAMRNLLASNISIDYYDETSR